MLCVCIHACVNVYVHMSLCVCVCAYLVTGFKHTVSHTGSPQDVCFCMLQMVYMYIKLCYILCILCVCVGVWGGTCICIHTHCV